MIQPKQQPTWHKSRACAQASCVEVARVDDQFLVRNSSEPDVVVSFTQDEWSAFMEGARAGQFD